MRKFDPYLLGGSASWFKIRNRNYLQWLGCEELFDGSAAPIQTIRDGKVVRSLCEDVLAKPNHGEIYR